MTRNDPFIRLRHMLDYSLEAISMAEGKTPAEIGRVSGAISKGPLA